jgi:hypothetical protein
VRIKLWFYGQKSRNLDAANSKQDTAGRLNVAICWDIATFRGMYHHPEGRNSSKQETACSRWLGDKPSGLEAEGEREKKIYCSADFLS